MSFVQMFEKRLDADGRPDTVGRLAALAEAVGRLPAEAAVRKLAPATVRPSAETEVPHPAGRRASAPGTGAVVSDLGAGARTDTGSDAVPGAHTDTYAIPVPEALAGLLPGGLRRGEAAVLATRSQGADQGRGFDRSRGGSQGQGQGKNQGPDYLALALLAEALDAGLWCAAIGVPELCVAALAGMLPASRRQAALDRLLLVPEPGEHWADVLATLADGVDLLLARPTTPVRSEVAHRIDARLRQGRSAGTRHSAALLVLGGWPTARLMLRVARTDWTGLDGIGPTAGTGHLTGGRATVVAQGRATAGRPRTARLWLPDATGSVRPLSDDPRTIAPAPAPATVPAA